MATKPKTKPKTIQAADPLPPAVDAFLDREQVARAIRCSLRHLQTRIDTEHFPHEDVRLAGKALWRCSTFNRWAADRVADTEATEAEKLRRKERAASGLAAITASRGAN